MSVKNASFFQLHIEKIILAVGALFLLLAIAVVVFGVVLKPYQVKVGNKTFDDPSEVVPAQVERAKVLNAGLQESNEAIPPAIPDGYEVPDLQTNFEQMLNQPVVRAEEFTPLANRGSVGQRGVRIADLVIDNITPPVYNLPTPPMPTDIKFKHGYEVLDTEGDQLADLYFDHWGETREPADFHYVFIEGKFDLSAWIESLEGSGRTGSPVPQGIWSRKLGLATSVMVREERDPQTGEWGNRTVVSILPDQFGAEPGKEYSNDNATAAYFIDQLLSRQLDVAMPEPPPLADGKELLPPLDDPMLQFTEEELQEMEDAERRAEIERRRAEREAERDRRRAEREAERNNNGGGGGELGPGGLGGPGAGRGGGRGGGAGRGGPAGGRGGSDSGRSDRDRRDEDRQRDREERDRRDAERNNNDSRGPGSGGPGLGGRNDGRGGIDNQDEFDEMMLRVWALDVTVQPGTSYRYKLVTGVINPLYGVNRLEESQLSENQHRLALLPSEEDMDKTPWVEVTIEPAVQFFVVSASDRGSRVNIWRIFNGEYVKEEFEVSAGDPIGGTVLLENNGVQRQVDMSVGATVVDIDRRKDINGNTVWTLIYIDDQGTLHERNLQEDQAAASQFERKLRELREARERAEEMAPGNQGAPDGFGPGQLGPGGLGPAANPGEPGRGRPGRGGGRGGSGR